MLLFQVLDVFLEVVVVEHSKRRLKANTGQDRCNLIDHVQVVCTLFIGRRHSALHEIDHDLHKSFIAVLLLSVYGSGHLVQIRVIESILSNKLWPHEFIIRVFVLPCLL